MRGLRRQPRRFALGMSWVYYPAIFRHRSDKDFGNAVLSRWPIIADKKIVLPHGMGAQHSACRRAPVLSHVSKSALIDQARLVEWPAEEERVFLWIIDRYHEQLGALVERRDPG